MWSNQGTCPLDLFQPKTSTFSTRTLISVHFKTVRYFSQPIFRLQVFKRGQYIQGAPTHAEGPGCDLPLLLHFQTPSLSLRPLIALCGVPMYPIQSLPWHQHVVQRSLLVGDISLLQYHHGVLDVPVPEMHPHGCPRRRLDTTPLKWAGPWSRLFRDHHPKRSGIVDLIAVSLVVLLPRPPSCYTVLVFAVDSQ